MFMCAQGGDVKGKISGTVFINHDRQSEGVHDPSEPCVTVN